MATSNTLLAYCYDTAKKTWTKVADAVRGTLLTGLSTATGGAIVATDTVLEALGKLQNQISGVDKSTLGLGDVDNVSAADLRDRTTHTGTQEISTVSGLQDALNAKAPLASPTFTGTVAVPAVTGNDSAATRLMFKDTGYGYYNADTTSSLDYTNGSHQRWAPSGSATLSISNWPPSGNLGELLIEGVNLGDATITWPTINWVLADGSTSTDFIDTEVELQASGTDWVLLWTRDAGTTVYGKVLR